MPQKRRVGLLTAGACLLAVVSTDFATAASQLPDEGIRRRLDGCWELRDQAATACFDGVDRIEVTASGTSDRGTYTVMNGRLLFDMSPEANPSREVYPSCQIDISAEQNPPVFELDSCQQWDQLGPIARPSGAALIADRSSKSWLDKALYAGDADRTINAPLKGCWDAIRSREREQMVKEATRELGGYLSSYEICFDGNEQGATSSVTFDAFDGWESSGRFSFVGGRLALTYGGDDASQERCTVMIDQTRLSMFDCALWRVDGAGAMVPVHASEPAEFTRATDRGS